MTKSTKARALASRTNGARSRSPVSPEGKASSAKNALQHGLRARTVTLLEDEDAAAFEALEAALRAELAPRSPLQEELVARIVLAAWRTRRAERMEGELFARHPHKAAEGPGAALDLGIALVRDAYGPRVVETLLRYRGSVNAEFFRALGALRVLQAEAEEDDQSAGAAATRRTRAGCEP